MRTKQLFLEKNSLVALEKIYTGIFRKCEIISKLKCSKNDFKINVGPFEQKLSSVSFDLRALLSKFHTQMLNFKLAIFALFLT